MSAQAHRPPRSGDDPVWLTGELEVAPSSIELPRGRASERTPVRLSADLRKRGESRLRVEVADLSTSGFCARAYRDLVEGMDIWLRLPGLESLPARVVWVDGSLVGCAFTQPLHPAVLDLILKRAGAR